MGEDALDKTSELYLTLPFMEAFPFEEYEISLEIEGTGPEELGIAPILIKNLGSFGTDYTVIFSYVEGENPIVVTINRDDVLYLAEVSNQIKKMSPVKEILDKGIASSRVEEKLESIKESRKFLKCLGSDVLLNPGFEAVLGDLLETNNVALSTEQMLAAQNRSRSKLAKMNFNMKQRAIIASFFNFQLHYAKILLGIIIAAKIY